MRYQFVFTVVTLLLAVSLVAGDKPDFSGDWEFSEEKSTLDEMGAAFLQTKMSIEQTEKEMTLKKTFQGPDGGEMEDEEKLTLDGKECKSEVWGGSPRVSTANWSEKGDALKIATTIEFERDGQSSTIDMNEVWSLGEEGKILSIKHSSSSEWGERDITMVFTKVEK